MAEDKAPVEDFDPVEGEDKPEAGADVLAEAQELADRNQEFVEKLRKEGVDDEALAQLEKITEAYTAIASSGKNLGDEPPAEDDAPPEEPEDESPEPKEDEPPAEDDAPPEEPEDEEAPKKKYTMDSALNETMDEARAKKNKKK